MTPENLLPDVLPHAPGCPDVTAEWAIRRAVTELCQRGKVWTAKGYEEPAGQAEYDLDLPSQSALVEVIAGPAGQVDFGEGVFIPDEPPTAPVTFEYAVKPSGDFFPDFIGQQYREAIISGALSLLLEMPGKDWTAPELALWHKGKFDAEIGRAVSRRVRGYTNKPLRVTPHGF